jgi:hypothetical protein
MSPFVASRSSPTPDVVMRCSSNVCVLSLCQLNLYIHNSTLPPRFCLAPCWFIPINLSVIFLSLGVRFDFPSTSFRSRCAFYACAICCDRCALGVLCLLHPSLLLLFLSSFIPCVIAFRPLTHLHCDTPGIIFKNLLILTFGAVMSRSSGPLRTLPLSRSRLPEASGLITVKSLI